jgi:hypothetical protein
MFETAGLMISGISLLNDLMNTFRDLTSALTKPAAVDSLPA